MKKFDVKRSPRRVDFLEHADDHDCALFAAMGFSTAFICEKTGLSVCQVTYRIRSAGLTKDNGASRSDFRNGRGPFAARVLAIGKDVDADLTKFLRAHL